MSNQDQQKESKPTPEPIVVIAVDFDGTCVTHAYPEIGIDCPDAVEVLRTLTANGAGLILFTMRHDHYLDEAVNWFADRNIPLYGIQSNPTQASWTSSNKCYAHLYIDDAAVGCPLTVDRALSNRPFVNWIAVDQLLQKYFWYTEPLNPIKTVANDRLDP
ncbi:hypothetical protein GCM10028805_37710 [Spirosoma harenae]